MVDLENAIDLHDIKLSVMRKAKSQKIKFLITAVLLLAISWIGYWVGYGSHTWHDSVADKIDQGGKPMISEGGDGNYRKPIRGGGQGSIIEEDHDLDKIVGQGDLKRRDQRPHAPSHDNIIIVGGNDRRPNVPNNHNSVDSHRHAQGIHQSHAQHISQHINSKFLKGQEDAGANPNIKQPNPLYPMKNVNPNIKQPNPLYPLNNNAVGKSHILSNTLLKPTPRAPMQSPTTAAKEEVALDLDDPFYTVVHSEVPTKVHSDIHKQLPRIESHVDPQSYTFTSQELPKNLNFLPTIGNGHIATLLHGDFIYMNNFYSGFKEQSHRAEIPSTVNVNITDIEPPTNYTRNLTLNAAEGTFTETLYNENFTIYHRTYAHRNITRLFVMEIELILHTSPSPITAMKLKFPRFSATTDLTMHQYKTNVSHEVSYKVGRINAPENDSLDFLRVFMYYDHVPVELRPIPGSARVKWIYLSTFGNTADDALSAYRQGQRLALQNDQLYAAHVRSWTEIWRSGRIDISGNLPLARAAYGSLYYLMSSLPTRHDPVNPFAGISPGGLAHGNFLKDYEGHVFWDQETWMLPPILMFHPDIAKLMLKGRVRRLPMAKKNAAKNSHDGAQYPWESAYTGIEVCPDKNVSRYEHHISGDISLAVRQYLHATRDHHFVGFEGAGEMLIEIANFWISRLTRNASTGLSGINEVMPPDEDHYPVNNSVYTNLIAKIALMAPSEAYGLLNISVQAAYKRFADNIYIPYDSKHQYHPEFDGYKLGTTVKQADVVLLGYPLLMPMETSIRHHDLLAYERVTRATGPAMTWSMFAIGWLELKQYIKAETAFLKNLNHIQGPFQVWSEEPGGQGAVNFLTGMGGFLQCLLNGYVGLRLRSDRLDLNPVLPPKSKGISLTGIDYLGSTFNIHVVEDYMYLLMTERSAGQPVLGVYVYSTEITMPLKVHENTKLKREKVAIMVHSPERTT